MVGGIFKYNEITMDYTFQSKVNLEYFYHVEVLLSKICKEPLKLIKWKQSTERLN
jgi:hypothetical protein